MDRRGWSGLWWGRGKKVKGYRHKGRRRVARFLDEGCHAQDGGLEGFTCFFVLLVSGSVYFRGNKGGLLDSIFSSLVRVAHWTLYLSTYYPHYR